MVVVDPCREFIASHRFRFQRTRTHCLVGLQEETKVSTDSTPTIHRHFTIRCSLPALFRHMPYDTDTKFETTRQISSAAASQNRTITGGWDMPSPACVGWTWCPNCRSRTFATTSRTRRRQPRQQQKRVFSNSIRIEIYISRVI